jgi:hypothetical protein
MFIQSRSFNHVLRFASKQPIISLPIFTTQTSRGGDWRGEKSGFASRLLRLQPDLQQHPRSLLTPTNKQYHTATMAELTHPTIKDGMETPAAQATCLPAMKPSLT